jgi:hypothetical protein
MRSVWVLLCLGAIGAPFSLAQLAPAAAPTPRFEDVTKKAGLTISHLSSPDKRYIIESMSGGVGFIDCDNSGMLYPKLLCGRSSLYSLRHVAIFRRASNKF